MCSPMQWTTKTVTMEAVAAPTSDAADMDPARFRLSFNIGVGGLRLVRGSWTADVVASVMDTLDQKLPGFLSDVSL